MPCLKSSNQSNQNSINYNAFLLKRYARFQFSSLTQINVDICLVVELLETQFIISELLENKFLLELLFSQRWALVGVYGVQRSVCSLGVFYLQSRNS